MLELYRNIRKFRKERKMSQEELAKKTGYTDRSSIAKIESGIIDLPQSKIILFADALGVKPGELMGNVEEEVPISGQEEHYYLDEETREILQFLNDNPEYKRILSSSRKLKPGDLEFIKAMIERFS